MTSTDTVVDEALRLDRAEKRGRAAKRLRTIVVVVLVLAAAFGGMAVWSATHRAAVDGPFCVWVMLPGHSAAPGGAVTPIQGFDVRWSPGGDTVQGPWHGTPRFPMSRRSWTDARQSLTRLRERSILDVLMKRGKVVAYYAWSSVEQTSPDGRTWTAFVLTGAGDRVISPEPDPACAGTWEIAIGDRESPQHVLRVDLLPSGRLRDHEGAWAVRDGALVIQFELSGAALHVGVLSDDKRSFTGLRYGWNRIRGRRVD